MTGFDRDYQVRELMLRRLREDLLGGPEDAEIKDEPLSRFVVGVLYPAVADDPRDVPASVEDTSLSDVEAESMGVGGETTADPGVALSKVRYPRSMGLTVSVAAHRGASLDVTVDAASYERDGEVWRRSDLPPWTHVVSLGEPGRGIIAVVEGQLELQYHVRAPQNGVVSLTLTLINIQRAARGARDGSCWFHPQIRVTPVGAGFTPRPAVRGIGADEREVESQNLLFRDVSSYAVGHGCAVQWQGDHPNEISTTFLPRHELLLSKAAGGEGLALGMESLAGDRKLLVLEDLALGYEAWIDGLRDRAQELSREDADTLTRHIAEAGETARRIRDGIALLRGDETVFQAFRLMSLAMAQQRSRQEHHRSGRHGDPVSTARAAWRPFQIAFILTNLRGVADPQHQDRDIADVLWFPTGGGKTEAYLGLIGVAILLRRLRDSDAGGVSVLMRYTLRLLTLQQYQRATGLICALEWVRAHHLPDATPISIGLWVGQASTPNSIKDAQTALNQARKGRSLGDDQDRSDPVQLRRCAWCGHTLDHRNYQIVDGTSMRVSCGNDACVFRNGLPVHIVDEDVYANRPSLVIATVDKFAMMPWKREVGALLGVEGAVHGRDQVILPPDLIVQDELHLISGPLGTVVALYETAVDAIAGITARPKVVASTATIRRASDQVRAVFAREARQFPPPGLSHRDSYFAVEATKVEKASREYAGVMAPGASHATLMVRVYSSLLQSASQVPVDDPEADLYWTLLGYFNSLRVLGAAYIQVLDDVRDHMKVIASRRGEPVRHIREPREMTSRKKSSEIPRELEILERPRGHDDAADTVLATNMISVGVDVDRLGLMIMMGQPQTSAEYIQATSRVGRQRPGLVVTLYNASRSRDLSHYENFAAYHRMLYRHVEATGATPLAPRARDRALHAVLVSMARHRIPQAAPDRAAGDAAEWEGQLREQVELICQRLGMIAGADRVTPADETEERIRAELDRLVEEWTEAGPVTHYEGWFSKAPGALLVPAGAQLGQTRTTHLDFPPQAPPWPTLTSMRDVDAEARVYLLRDKDR